MALQPQHGKGDQPLQPVDRQREMQRCPSYDSQRSSIEIAISPDESVEDSSQLQKKCDTTEDVIRPIDASRGEVRASLDFDMADPGDGRCSPNKAVLVEGPRHAGIDEPAGFASGSEGSGYEPGAYDDDAISLNESVQESVDGPGSD